MVDIKMVVTALMDYEVLKGSIQGACNNANDSFNLCNQFLSFSPFRAEFSAINACVNVVQGTAMTLAVVFFLIEFFSKTIQLEWVKWENIVMLFAKLFVAKALIDNAPALMNIIYSGFSGLQADLSTTLSNLTGNNGKGFLPETFDGTSIEIGSRDLFIGDKEAWKVITDDNGNFIGTAALMKWLELQPTFLMLSLIMVLCQVIVLGRVFELMVYTIMAPLPLATFTSSTTNDVGKTFLKSYCAICLQAFILIVMFAVFRQLLPILQQQVSALAGYSSTLALLLTGTLAMGIMKSGSWAKKLCGTA